MYTVDGEILESIEEIEDDCQLVIVSDDRYTFKGIANNKNGLSPKHLRMENAKLVKSKLENQNKEWAN